LAKKANLLSNRLFLKRPKPMKTNPLFLLSGWSAYLNAIINMISFVSLFVYFSSGGPSGLINDIASIFFSLSLIPLVIAFHALHRSFFPLISGWVASIGVLAMLSAALLQALLVFGILQFEQEVRPVLVANAVIGIWLILSGVMTHIGRTLPHGLAWLSIIAGIGLILIIVGFWIGRQEHFLTIAGGLVSFLGILIWTIWSGKCFLGDKVTFSG
jgi:hypothetical protein